MIFLYRHLTVFFFAAIHRFIPRPSTPELKLLLEETLK
jgi:hypothetical protein